MPTPKPLIVTIAVVALAAAISAAALFRPASKPSNEHAAAATTEPDSGLARAMTFTEPKK